ncbi:Protein GrpE [Candidatus Bilamarchaeum dharawalense]|uniref:Protein GrpE n=1 Tax=Candidatus Bilamarchaeum dharawalense TaxID=2885759 RepID=A0A5E4LPB3_9ARCH|nr:Protein GrpE [Candidatus Bilamarchaeum dharawalense]
MLKVQTNTLGDFTSEKLGNEKKPEIAAPDELKMVGAPEEMKLVGDDAELLQERDKKIKELEEKIMRLQAEFENYKKRVIRENEMIKEKANADAMLKLLSIADEFDMAMMHIDSASPKEFEHGVELIYAKLLDLLKKDGVEEMKSINEKFDPFKHDALRQAEGEDGKIVEVIQKGYYIDGKILRHAKVVVGKAKEEKR